MTEEQTIVEELSCTLHTLASESAADWDYVSYVFKTFDGVDYEGTNALFKGTQLLEFSLRSRHKIFTEAFNRLRLLSKENDGRQWNKCNLVVNAAGEHKIAFEYGDTDRWNLGPTAVDRMFEILVVDVFPQS